MEDNNRIKDQTPADRNSTSSKSKLIPDNTNKTLTDEQAFDRQETSIKKTKEDSRKKMAASESSPTQSPTDKPSFRGPFGTTVSTIVWYICICILFVIAFLALVLSILYFITDTSTEQVIKLYGITGSSVLAIFTFIIVFLDCCNDGSAKDFEDETIYQILQMKKAREKARRSRQIADGKEEKAKPLITHHQQPQQVPSHPYPYHHHHHHYHPHYIYAPPPTSHYHHPFSCPVCHDFHTPRHSRHHLYDVGVDTSDKFEPVSKSRRTTHKSTRDAQTQPKIYDAEHGTQTDRTEGTQTSTMEFGGPSSNVAEIIHETTILKAPRSLLPALRKSMVQQDKDIAIAPSQTNTNAMTATFV